MPQLLSYCLYITELRSKTHCFCYWLTPFLLIILRNQESGSFKRKKRDGSWIEKKPLPYTQIKLFIAHTFSKHNRPLPCHYYSNKVIKQTCADGMVPSDLYRVGWSRFALFVQTICPKTEGLNGRHWYSWFLPVMLFITFFVLTNRKTMLLMSQIPKGIIMMYNTF